MELATIVLCLFVILVLLGDIAREMEKEENEKNGRPPTDGKTP